ncbi:MAG: PKD domain-containing protein [Flavobacteriales bacterium]
MKARFTLLFIAGLIFSYSSLEAQCPTVSGNTSPTCGQTTTLTASGGSSYQWFSNNQGTGNPLSTSASFTTPPITTSTTYYAASPGGLSNVSGFTSCYATNNWSLSQTGNANGSVNTGNAPTSIVFTGPDGVSGGVYTRYQITIPATGTLSFNWSVQHNDCCSYDYFGYTLNGANTALTWGSGSGFTSIAVSAGSTFSFTGYTTDGCCGTFNATISNFSAPCQSLCFTPVVVNPSPIAAPVIGYVGNSILCTGTTVTLNTNQNTGLTWSTGATTPTITVSTPGTYSATYTDGNGCTSNASNPVTLNLFPGPSAPSIINLNPLSGCAYDTTFLQASLMSGITWSSGDTGQTIPAIVQGTYTATVTDVNGCISPPSNPLTVTVNPAPIIASASTPDICLGLTTPFNANVQLGNTNNASISSVAWAFGDNNTGNTLNSPHTYANTGSYPVSLIVSTNHGCSDTLLTTVLVNPKPSIASTTGAAVCHTNATLFNHSTTVANVNGAQVNGFAWTFGDGNQSGTTAPNHTYAQPGTYPVQLIVSTNHGCSDTATLSAVVNPNPVVGSVSIPSGCQGAATALNTNVSVANVNGALISSTVWTSGDGGNANGAQTTYNYAQPGTYNAYVVATTNHGCTDTSFGLAVVNPTPQITSTTFPDVCFGNPTLFLQNSTLANVNGAQITGYLWTFGDGTTSPSMNPTKTYAQTGAFPVSFTIQTNQNCPAVFYDTVLVNPYPVISSVSAADVCQGTPSSFVQNSSVPPVNGSIVNAYQWDFGGGNTSNQANPSFSYANPGTYIANVTVTTNYGCSSSSSGPAIVNPNPVISTMNVADVCLGVSNAFNASAFVAPANGSVIASTNWDLADGNQSAQTNFSHVYASPGQYNTVLTVTSNNGCSTSQTATVLVNPNPTINQASVLDVCQQEFSAFNAAASVQNINGANIAAYQWNFGDGNNGSGSTPNHVYANWGNYSWNVTATTNHGCTDVFSGSTTILPKPQAAFTLPDHCRGTIMPITNSSSIGSGSIVSTQWTTSNGMNSTMQVPSLYFTNAGNYTVTLMLTSDLGCKDTLTQNVVVTEMINSNFSPTLLTTNTVHFLPDTLDPYLDYFWDFGDGTYSLDINPQKLFFFPGLYTVCLTITDNGCSSTTCNPVQLNVAGGLDQLGDWSSSIYPNPFDRELNVALSGLNQAAELRLRDLSGRVLLRHHIQPASGQANLQLSASELAPLPAGVYILSVESDAGNQHYKVVKK